MLVVQILFWVLLIIWAVLGPPWGAWGDRTPAWSGHLVQIILFVCLGLAVFSGGFFLVR
jgi:hypothetical protein